MGKVLVLYNSASENTASMARLVGEGMGLIPPDPIASENDPRLPEPSK
jgi:hypothetical protein